jgi:hypothetical protein
MLRKCGWVCAALLSLLPTAALAQGASTGAGPRVGFSIDPDQFLVGGQLVVGPVAPNITFDPSLELGFGDNVDIVALNFDMHYHFTTRSTWRPYLGAGATINWVNYNNDFGNGSSDTLAGGGIMFGAGVPTSGGSRFFGELKAGLSNDVPDLKFVVGWNFKI